MKNHSSITDKNSDDDPLRNEFKTLLNQREDLADLERAAAVKEKTLHVAHDIRNPLATIQTICASLLLEIEDVAHRERLRLITNQIEQMGSILSEAVNREDTRDDPPMTLDLEELLCSLANLLLYQNYDGISVQVEMEPGLTGCLPQGSLSVSIYQLLRNAARALDGHENGQIRLTCHTRASWLIVSVIDNGPGLPSELLEKGLRRYASQRNSTLELSNIERFVSGLGGRIEFQNPESGGACVTLYLPLHGSDAASAPSPQQERRTAGRD